jgi:predicted MFS family arabinose efflux permease
MVVGLAVTLLGLAAFIPRASILTLVLAGAGTGIGAGLFSNGLLTELLNMSSDRNRGPAMSFSIAAVMLGVFAGSTAAGLLIGNIGFTGVMAIGGLCCILGLPLAGLKLPAGSRLAPNGN